MYKLAGRGLIKLRILTVPLFS